MYLNLPSGARSWKPPVDDVASLPSAGNSNGDARVTLDTYTIYIWNGSTWIPSGGGGGDTDAIYRDDTQPPTTDISWDNFKITDLANGTNPGDAVNRSQLDGKGDFSGPASSTDSAIVLFDGTTGKLGKNSTVTIDSAGRIAPASGSTVFGTSAAPSATSNTVVAIGASAGNATTTGTNNVYIGNSAGALHTVGNATLVGSTAGAALSTGNSCTFIGRRAGNAETTGNNNTMVGANAGLVQNGASNNTFLGSGAAIALSTGTDNLYVGHNCGPGATTGSGNVFLGASAGTNGMHTTGTNNIVIGSALSTSGTANAMGSSNIVIGSYQSFNRANWTSGSSNIFIGNAIVPPVVSDSTTLLIGHNSTFFIKGDSSSVSIGSGKTFKIEDYVGSKVVVSSGTSVVESTVTTTELGLLSGKTSLGDVVGPASSTDEAIARFDSTTGKLLQNSTSTLSDTGLLTTKNLTLNWSSGTPLYLSQTVMPNNAGVIYADSLLAQSGAGTASFGQYFVIDINGSNNSRQVGGLRFDMMGNSTSTSTQFYGLYVNVTGRALGNSIDAGTYNRGLNADCHGTATTGRNVGGVGRAYNANYNYGLIGYAFTGTGSSPKNIGILGTVDADAAGGYMGGCFLLNTTGNVSADTIPGVNACIVGDNTTTTGSLIILRDNGTTAFEVADGGNVTAATGNIIIDTAGKGLKIKEGSNATSGVATLVAGTVTVNTTAVTATSRIQLTAQNLGTIVVPAALAVSARSAGTSFTILSSDGTDTSDVAWTIIEPA